MAVNFGVLMGSHFVITYVAIFRTNLDMRLSQLPTVPPKNADLLILYYIVGRPGGFHDVATSEASAPIRIPKYLGDCRPFRF